MSADPTPGRSLVTRRAIRDLVRTATLATYGVTGFSGGGPLGRLLERLGIAHPGLRLEVGETLTIDLDLDVAYGLPVAEVARQVDASVRYAIVRRAGPRAGPRSRSASGTSATSPGRPRSRSRRPRRTSRGPRTSPAAGRTSPDGPPVVRRCRVPRGVPERRREPRGARRRDQRAERVPGAGRRHRHQHAGDGPGGAGGGRSGRARRGRRAGRPGGELRRADGRARQLGRDHEPDPGRDRARPGRQAPLQRPRPRPCARPRHARPRTRPSPSPSRARS